ncbi:hypothetical protein Tco_0672441 [Tanacetum coccineum]
MRDLNASLNLEDCHSGSSNISLSMREFKECMCNIVVQDVNSLGLYYTWNQKPKGGEGIFKKLDRVMCNKKFMDEFIGTYAIFQQYRISNHSPVEKRVDGYKMFQIVYKLKKLKGPFRKLIKEHGNLHLRVERLRFELDEAQKALDLDPSSRALREEEAGVECDTTPLIEPNLFTTKLLDDVHDHMVRVVSNNEIMKAIDVCEVVHDFFTNGKLLKELNHMIVALIPKVLMKALEEFKEASRLIPSIPKSMAYFCNVVNHVKVLILSLMPFKEGHLPVKYLGVQLISSRLLYKECKILVEKLYNRIGDWRNKTLSFAKRLQLILGKVKVAFDSICYPKNEGGLRIRRTKQQFFKKKYRTEKQVRDVIIANVSLKLISLQFKKSLKIAKVLEVWKFSNETLIHKDG